MQEKPVKVLFVGNETTNKTKIAYSLFGSVDFPLPKSPIRRDVLPCSFRGRITRKPYFSFVIHNYWGQKGVYTQIDDEDTDADAIFYFIGDGDFTEKELLGECKNKCPNASFYSMYLPPEDDIKWLLQYDVNQYIPV